MARGYLSYFIRSYRVTFLLIVGLAILGVFTVINLPREATPEIDVPFAAVVTAFPGSSSRDVEDLIADPIEDVVLNLTGVKEVSSSSRPGISSIFVEFFADEDIDESLRRLREAVDKVSGLPADGDSPQVVAVNFSNEPILSIGLGGIEDERLLTVYAEVLADQIESVAGVASVNIVGSRDIEISVAIDPAQLADFGLSISQLVSSISQANINAPFGSLETEQFAYDLRLKARFTDVSDVSAIPITTPSGEVIPLSELANITLTLSDSNTKSRMSVARGASTPSVSLQVMKKPGGNIITIVDAIDEQLTTAKETQLPDYLVIETFADRADEIRRSLGDVTRSGLQTLLIVVTILWLFLGWQAALITAIAIPLTFFMSFIVFDITDTTINGISLFSLILSLGLLVDNAIVIVEGIHSRSSDADLPEHAAQTVNQFKKPLIGGTLTTVAAFFPMVLVSGIIGQFLRTIPIVVGATLISSLFVALAIIPAVAVRALITFKPPVDKQRRFDVYFEKFRGWYSRFIERALTSRRFQNIFISALVLMLLAGLALPFSGLLKTGLFPAVDIDFMIINAELPPGSRLEQTIGLSTQIEDALLATAEVTSYVANLGSSSTLDLGGGSSSANLISYFINLDTQRDRTSLEVSADLRARLSTLTEAKVIVEEISAGPPSAPPVELRVTGENLAVLDEISLNLMTQLEEIPGAIEIDRNLRVSAGEFSFALRRTELAQANLSAAQVAQTLRTSVFGVEATTFLDQHGDEISVRLKAQGEAVNSISNLTNLPLVTRTGTITLGEVADVSLNTSFDAIRRRNGIRTVTVTAQADDSTTPNEITQAIEVRLASASLPLGYQVESGGEQQETVETFNELYRSMFIAVILILIILVVEFNSYRQPMIIFLSVPLSLIGVLFGLLLTGGQLNFATFIGLVSLTGIVVNNAIILVDRMNHLRKNGLETLAAVKQAVESRLRPVILTTITTAAGVAPLIFVDEFFRDIALTIITGLLFSTILTLVFIPILYLRQQRKIERRNQPHAPSRDPNMPAPISHLYSSSSEFS